LREILIVANRTVGGEKLLDLVREKAQEADTRFVLVVPQDKPPHGGVIYDEAVRQAAEVRLSLAQQAMDQEGIKLDGEVGDEDPFTAIMDGIAIHKPAEVIISTLPRAASGWLRRDLVERVREESGVPVEHVVTDVDREGLHFKVTLVLANQTLEAADLIEHLKAKAADGEHLFIVVVPQEHGEGNAAREARDRLAKTINTLRGEGLLVSGMIGNPDPYEATMNALHSFLVDDVVISTLPATKSGWLRGDLIERVRDESGKPVEHVEAEASAPSSTPATA
jgi:hypothetical protein